MKYSFLQISLPVIESALEPNASLTESATLAVVGEWFRDAGRGGIEVLDFSLLATATLELYLDECSLDTLPVEFSTAALEADCKDFLAGSVDLCIGSDIFN